MQLDGKVAIVTGGGRGIGRAIVRRFAQEGAAVVIAGTSAEHLESTAAEVRAQAGRALACVTDIANEAAVEHLVSATRAAFGGVDLLVNNAGITGPTAPATRVTIEDWNRTLAVNLTGAFLCAKHALPHMIKRGGGRIINIASVAGTMAYALRSPYAVSKWGMIGLTRTLADEAGPHNITVNAIAPGPVHGARMERVIRGRAQEMGRSVEEVERAYVEPTALKRMVEEEDIAGVVLFLASDAGRSITGETIAVTGGFRL